MFGDLGGILLFLRGEGCGSPCHLVLGGPGNQGHLGPGVPGGFKNGQSTNVFVLSPLLEPRNSYCGEPFCTFFYLCTIKTSIFDSSRVVSINVVILEPWVITCGGSSFCFSAFDFCTFCFCYRVFVWFLGRGRVRADCVITTRCTPAERLCVLFSGAARECLEQNVFCRV